MSSPPLSEAERLQLLSDYGIVDTESDATLDQLVALAATICDAPISLVSLVDETRQWFKARVGLAAQETPRDQAFCAHVVAAEDDGLFVVNDARTDARFSKNPLVTREPNVVFYAGAPLIGDRGAKLGTLCVIDRRPRDLTETQRHALSILSQLVMQRIAELRDRRESAAAEARLHALVTSMGEAVVSTDRGGNVLSLNPVAERLTGWTFAEAKGTPIARVMKIVNEQTRAVVENPVERALREGRIVGLANHTILLRRDGVEVPIDDSAGPVRNARDEVTGAVIVFRDVSEKKRLEAEREALLVRAKVAQAEAEAERKKQHDLFQQAPMGVAVLEGPDHTFTFANTAYRALVGGREVEGKTLFEALPDVRGQGFDKLLDRVVASEEPFVGTEIPVKLAHHAAGESLFLDFVYAPKRNAAGKVDGVLVSAADVTEQVLSRRRVEALVQQVERSEARLRSVLEAAGAGLWDLDAASGFIESDPRTIELMGLPRGSTMTLSSGLMMLPDDDRQRVRTAVTNALKGDNGGRYQMEFRTGGLGESALRWVESRAQVAFDAEGRAMHLAGVMIDVTARKEAEQVRALASERITEVLETMGDGFFAVDAEWRLTLVNTSYERLSQTKRAEVLGKSFWQIFPALDEPASPYSQEYRRCMQTREPGEFVAYYAPLDLWTDVRVRPTSEGGISVFFRDVSAERRAQEALRVRAEFEQHLIGIVSHDLRNPLSAIALAAALLTRREEMSERATQLVVRIQNGAERATRMVSDLLDFTQARVGGGIPIEPRRTDLHSLVANVLEEIEAAHPSREIALRSEGDGRGEWDPDRLGQVVQNLVTNALKYGSPDRPVEVTTRTEQDSAFIAVHNAGTPIDPAMLATLFEPFQRGMAPSNDKTSRSVGLGLYIVHQIVDAHGGSVAVTSTLQGGTTFSVVLPRRTPRPTSSHPETSA